MKNPNQPNIDEKPKNARKKWTENDAATLRRLYPNNPAAVIARLLGRTARAVNVKADRMDLRKSYMFLLVNSMHLYSPEGKAARQRVINSDRRRWRNDLPQKTRFHFSNQTADKISFRFRMRRKGYVEYKEEKNVMYYDEHTRRSLVMEQRALMRHNIRVRPL